MSAGAFAVRRATLADAPRVAGLFVAYCRFYKVASAREELAEAFVAERMGRGEAVVFVAEDGAPGGGGAPIGFTLLYPKFSSTSMRRDWLLNDLFVDEAARRRGVAGALMDAAESFARAEGAAKIALKTQRNNDAARALYAARGWREDEEFASYALRL